MSDIEDVIRHSVTKNDVLDWRERGGVLLYQFWNNTASSIAAGIPPRPPTYWSWVRDDVLRSTMYAVDSMWPAAVGKAISTMVSAGWDISDSDDSSRRVARSQDMCLTANGGQGWVAFLSQHLRDYLLTDNGTFVEIIRSSSASGSRVLGIMHLDSRRCKRTGDPTTPVIYRDRLGVEHEMKDYQVFALSDMPDPGETYFGVGFCAASRAYTTIYKMSSIEQYISEKVSGSRATEMHIINTSERTIETMINTAKEEQHRKGAFLYQGVVIGARLGDGEVSGYRIPLAEVPDGFDAKQERDNAYMIYANAIGIPVQDIQPLHGQGLGTGTQSVILDEAAQGQGLAAWRKQFEHMLNTYVLPETTTFLFSNNDIRDQKMEAEVKQLRATTRAAQIQSGEITPAIALQMAVDSDDVPREFLPKDVTPEGQLSDTEKPVGNENPTLLPDVQSILQQAMTPAVPPQAQKANDTMALDDVIALLKEAAVMAKAKKLYHGVS